MPEFLQRSMQRELMDSPVPAAILYKNLHELDRINHLAGGHAASLSGIKALVSDKRKLYHIVDLGCGGGGTLRAMADWARKENYNVILTGVDQNRDAIAYLTEKCKSYPEINGIVSDYRRYIINIRKADIVHCSLFLHHLTDNEISELLGHFNRVVKTGFVINDLERSALAYYCVKLLTRLAATSKISRSDGPLSVLKSFRREELFPLLKSHCRFPFEIKSVRIFRLLVVADARA